MRKKQEQVRGITHVREKTSFFGIMRCTLYTVVLAAFITGCAKEDSNTLPVTDPLKAAGIDEIFPANLADSVVVDPVITVIFKSGTDQAVKNATVLTLKQGSNVIPGTLKFKGDTAAFTASDDLMPDNDYTATVQIVRKGDSGSDDTHEYTWKFRTGTHHGDYSLSVISVLPLKDATSVSGSFQPVVTFNREVTYSMRNSVTFVLNQGSTHVDGSVSFSGKTATFKPSSGLIANKVYTGKVTIGSHDSDDSDDHESNNSYTWSFTTGDGVVVPDVTTPVISSVVPSNNATLVAVNSNLTVNFSEAMNPSTISASTFTLKIGTVAVAGTVSYSGTTATFTPTLSLVASTVYTATITTAAKDVAGNAIPTNYNWNFTTAPAVVADIVAPTILSTLPLNGATSVALNSKITAAFSEAMNASTISSATFTLKQGTATIPGTVTYSGTTATFTPSTILTGSFVYTASITTAAKDVAGNSLGANVSWSFTTIVTPPPVTGLSFAGDVVPALNACNVCHKHNWTASTVSSTFYANLVSSGYVNSASPTTSKLYTKINGGHPGSSSPASDITKILTWMTQGSLNN